MKKIIVSLGIILIVFSLSGLLFAEDIQKTRTVTDSLGRSILIPEEVNSVICSGAGGLRYLTYLNMQDRVIGVDSTDAGEAGGRPYAIAHPEFQNKPVIGDFKGS